MHVGFIPFHAASINDIVWIHDCMRLLLKNIRAAAPVPIKKWRECAHCANLNLVEYHHPRPLWSVAAEAILAERPQSLKELSELHLHIARGNAVLETKEFHENLIPLCRWCHDLATIHSNKEWKTALSERYPLLWTYRFEMAEFEALIEQWYMQEVRP